MGGVCRDFGDDCAAGGHAAHFEGVDWPRARDNNRRCARRAGERDIRSVEACYWLVEGHGKEYWRGVGWVGLTSGLFDRDGCASSVIRHFVIGAGAGRVAVACRILGGIGGDGRDDCAIICHAAHFEGVNWPRTGDIHRCRARRARENDIRSGKSADRLAEGHGKQNRRGVGWVGLAEGLLYCHSGGGGIVGDFVVGAGAGRVAVTC